METMFFLVNHNSVEYAANGKEVVDMLFIGATAFLSAVSAYLGSYLSKKGGLKAIKEDFSIIKDQHEELERVAQEIKSTLDKENILYQIKKNQEVSRKVDEISGIISSFAEIVRVGKWLGLSVLSGRECSKDVQEFSILINDYRIKSVGALFWVGSDVLEEIESVVVEIDNYVHRAVLLKSTDPAVHPDRYRTEEKDRKEVEGFFFELDRRVLEVSANLKENIFQ